MLRTASHAKRRRGKLPSKISSVTLKCSPGFTMSNRVLPPSVNEAKIGSGICRTSRMTWKLSVSRWLASEGDSSSAGKINTCAGHTRGGESTSNIARHTSQRLQGSPGRPGQKRVKAAPDLSTGVASTRIVMSDVSAVYVTSGRGSPFARHGSCEQ